jgi:hypothetical protein
MTIHVMDYIHGKDQIEEISREIQLLCSAKLKIDAG